MALFLTDEELDALAERAQRVLNAPTKKDAVRQALERVVGEEVLETSEATSETSLRERLDQLRREFKLPAYETLKPFDEKAFLDEMWGENDVHR